MAKPKKKGSGGGSGKGTVALPSLKGVTGSKKRITLIPEGEYLAKVTGVRSVPGGGKEKSFKSGRGGMVWQFDVGHESKKINGARFWLNNVYLDTDGSTMEDSLWTLRSVLESLDPSVGDLDKLRELKLDRLKGRDIGLEIVTGEYNDKPKSEINQTFHPSQLEDDDEDDEEDDDEEEEEDEDDEDYDDDDDEEDEEEDEDDDEDDDEDEWTWEDVENASSVKELREIAEDLGVSTKPPKGKERVTQKMLRKRLEAVFEDEDEDEEGEIDLDDVDL